MVHLYSDQSRVLYKIKNVRVIFLYAFQLFKHRYASIISSSAQIYFLKNFD